MLSIHQGHNTRWRFPEAKHPFLHGRGRWHTTNMVCTPILGSADARHGCDDGGTAVAEGVQHQRAALDQSLVMHEIQHALGPCIARACLAAENVGCGDHRAHAGVAPVRQHAGVLAKGSVTGPHPAHQHLGTKCRLGRGLTSSPGSSCLTEHITTSTQFMKKSQDT